MIYKPRNESNELLILKYLSKRMDLLDKDKQHYYNLKKGYEGEVMFDSIIENYQCDSLILNDLLLKTNNTTFQIDSMIITHEAVHLFEVKNFEGDYYYESDRLFKGSKLEISNPLNQLVRSESLLRQLFYNLGFDLPINAHVVFINPEFTLYQSPLNKPFLYPTQIHRFLKDLNLSSSMLTPKHKILAHKLVSMHITDSPFKQLPCYEYDHLQKGITCLNCESYFLSVQGKKVVCTKCGTEEILEFAVIRSIDELKILFPEKEITTNLIFDWCKIVSSKKRIRRILDRNFEMVGVHQWSYYV